MPRLLSELSEVDDFYVELDWNVVSWIPMLGKLAPKDKLKIWKVGAQIRLDSNIRSMNGMKTETGLMSFIVKQKLNNNINQSAPVHAPAALSSSTPAQSICSSSSSSPSSPAPVDVYLLDHVDESYSDALQEFRNPSYDLIEYEVSTMINNHKQLPNQQLHTKDVQFKVILIAYNHQCIDCNILIVHSHFLTSIIGSERSAGRLQAREDQWS